MRGRAEGLSQISLESLVIIFPLFMETQFEQSTYESVLSQLPGLHSFGFDPNRPRCLHPTKDNTVIVSWARPC